MKSISIVFFTVFCAVISNAQSIGIGTTTPDASAVLDVKSGNKGMLVPRVALTAINVAAPITAPADALLIYNTATAGTGESAVSPGFYYWNTSTMRWTAIATRTSDANQGNVGFGAWSDCPSAISNIGAYNPVYAEDGITGDNLGYSVSISGDYAIIGCDVNSSNDNSGYAYIFHFDGTNWMLQQKISASDAAGYDRFGFSVSMSGNNAIVGAWGKESEKGAAYIFHFNGTNWVEQQKLISSDAAVGDHFGNSVSIHGSYAVIGANGDDEYMGSAYLFHFDNTSGNWVQLQKFTAGSREREEYDNFGNRVAIYGLNIIVGAVEKDAQKGAAYAFYSPDKGVTWVAQQKLTPGNGSPGYFFGNSISISGNHAFIGMYGDNDYSGSVYDFYLDGTSWILHQKLIAGDGNNKEGFGSSVSISGNTAIIGSVSVGQTKGLGSAYIFHFDGTRWLQQQKITRPGGSGDPEYFGWSCSVDNNGRFVIGAYGAMGGETDGRGKAFFGKINE